MASESTLWLASAISISIFLTLCYAASAAVFVYAGQSDGLRPGAADAASAAGKPE